MTTFSDEDLKQIKEYCNQVKGWNTKVPDLIHRLECAEEVLSWKGIPKWRKEAWLQASGKTEVEK